MFIYYIRIHLGSRGSNFSRLVVRRSLAIVTTSWRLILGLPLTHGRSPCLVMAPDARMTLAKWLLP